MKKLLAFLALAGAGVAAFGQALPAPEIAAREYLLIDMNAGQVLAERAADAPVDPASFTMLMTAYVAFVQLKEHKLALDQKLPVSARALAERKGGGALMFVDATAAPTVDVLWLRPSSRRMYATRSQGCWRVVKDPARTRRSAAVTCAPRARPACS